MITYKGDKCCDSDQCSTNQYMSNCPANSACINDCESFHCKCDAGFEMINGSCEEICDENQCFDPNSCQANSECTDLCQNFECTCNAGYFMEEDDLCCDAKQCDLFDNCPANSICNELCEGKGTKFIELI